MHRTRFLLGYAFVFVTAAALAAGVLWQVRAGGRAAASPPCPFRIPQGESTTVVWDTTKLFVSEVVLRRNPVCGYDLSSNRLRHGLTRRQVASGKLPIETMVSRYPPVPMERASRNPRAPQAVYMLSRRVRDFVVPDAEGRPEVPMAVGIAAPDAGARAYNVVLVLDRGSWRVDRVSRINID